MSLGDSVTVCPHLLRDTELLRIELYVKTIPQVLPPLIVELGTYILHTARHDPQQLIGTGGV